MKAFLALLTLLLAALCCTVCAQETPTLITVNGQQSPVRKFEKTKVFNDVNEQRRILARIKEVNGLFFYDFEFKVLIPQGTHKYFDIEQDCDVVCIEMDSAGKPGVKYETIDDAFVKDICKLTRLKKLRLPKANITDVSYQAISALPELEEIDFVETKITNEEVRRFVPMKALKSLRLSGCNISDGAIGDISRMHNLEQLYLDRTLVTDAGLLELQKLSKLSTLWVSGGKITAAGLEALLSKTDSIKYIAVEAFTISAADINVLKQRYPTVLVQYHGR